MKYKFLMPLSMLVTMAFAAAIHAQEPPSETPVSETPAADPLAGFARLVGGRWHLDDSYLTFEWGPGQRSVRARSYFVVEGAARLVSEGHWYWHPGERELKGSVVAIEMPVELFEFTTRFEGDRVVSDLLTYDAEGTKSEYVETWEFLDENRYEWTLFSPTPDGLQVVMRGTYTRADEPDHEQ